MTHPKILVIIGTAVPDTLCHALATAYSNAATAAGAQLRIIDLATDPVPAVATSLADVRMPRRSSPPPDPAVVRYREEIVWADHLVFVFPQWWGTYPAAMKAFIDAAFAAGLAHRYHATGRGWDRLLKGRTARIITTFDSPVWWSRYYYASPGERALRVATLGYCGVKTLATTRLSQVRHRDPAIIDGWIARAGRLGESDASRRRRGSSPAVDRSLLDS